MYSQCLQFKPTPPLFLLKILFFCRQICRLHVSMNGPLNRTLSEPVCCSPPSPAGQHLHCGLRRRLPGDHPRSSLRFHLHRVWNHPQRSAHIHPLQQVLRLLLQTQVQPIHSLDEEAREVQNRQQER